MINDDGEPFRAMKIFGTARADQYVGQFQCVVFLVEELRWSSGAGLPVIA